MLIVILCENFVNDLDRLAFAGAVIALKFENREYYLGNVAEYFPNSFCKIGCPLDVIIHPNVNWNVHFYVFHFQIDSNWFSNMLSKPTTPKYNRLALDNILTSVLYQFENLPGSPSKSRPSCSQSELCLDSVSSISNCFQKSFKNPGSPSSRSFNFSTNPTHLLCSNE